MKTTCLIFTLLFSIPSLALVLLPTGVNYEQRKELTYTLGVNTSSKLLTPPFALGGYSGLEMGLSVEKIALKEYNGFATPDLVYPKFSLGKGLYNNIDIFLEFAPPLRQHLVAQYGSLIKWSFYEGTFFPISIALNLHASTSTVEDSISSTSVGADLTAGMTLERTSVYIGIGQVKTQSAFIGIKNSINFTDDGLSHSHEVQQSHSLIGATYQWTDYFVSVQIDRYQTPVYSTKIGMRL